MRALTPGDHITNISSCPRPRQPHARPKKPRGGATAFRDTCGNSSVGAVPGGAAGKGGHYSQHNHAMHLVVDRDDMEAIASLFGRITAMKRRHPSRYTEGDADAETSLDVHVRVAMRTMKERLACLREGPLQDVEVIMAKHSLYGICFKELISVTGATDPYLGCVLETLQDAHCDLLETLTGILRGTLIGYQQEISVLGEGREHDAKEAAELVEAARALEKEAETQHRQLRDLRRRLGELEEENASLKDNSTACPPLVKPPTPPKRLTANASHRLDKKSGRATLAVPTMKLCDVGERTRPALSPGSCRTTVFTGEAENGANTSVEGRATAAEVVSDSRKLSVKQLKSLIASIFVSKEKHDRRCAAQRMPSQTLATHVDDFLVHRYGLTPMARIQAAALWEGVENFREEDNRVKVFEMTLRNEVDERFRVDQQNLEQTIVEIIRAIIRDRTARHERADVDDRRRDYRRRSGGAGISRASGRPRKVGQAFATASAVAIDSLVRSQTRPGASLAAADWQAVVRYVYRGAPADAQTVGVLVKEAAMNHGRGGQGFGAGKGKSRQGRVGSRGSPVPFGFFLQVLLGYQLHGHLRCLRNFKEDFRKVDVDADGVVNPSQFLALAKRTLRRAQEAAEPPAPTRTDRHRAGARGGQDNIDRQATIRLRAADPHGCGRITFSECVDHLVRGVAV